MASVMQDMNFDPQPLLRQMAQSIVADYGRRQAVHIAERAIVRLARKADIEGRDIWLEVHALLHSAADFITKPVVVH
jgi:hypothetical protein